MQKIKVLHIITRMDKGGSAENTFLTITGLNKDNYEVTLMSGPVEDSPQDRTKEIEAHDIKYIFIFELVRDISIIKDLKTLFKIYDFLRKEKFDIVHTHTSKAGLLGRLAAKLAGVPIIVHTPHGHVFFGYFKPAKTKIFIFLEKLASRITDKIVALTDREKDDYRLFKTTPEEKAVVINSGVDLNRFKELSFTEKQSFKKELGLPENALIVGTVGRLAPVKGQEFLIEAVKNIIPKYPSALFMFAGDGHLRQNLERKALEMGIKENVVFLGWRDDVDKIISIYDIFVLPSLNEGMGRVLVEAMALGKPIVASHAGGIPDLIRHGKNGFLVPPRNPEQLAKYIQILIEDKEKRERMGQAGKKIALNFSKEVMIEKIASLYDELLTKKNILSS
ncbi:MAG: glycosyltransferase [Candidatus Aminicenantes bacterium]|nr:glycosyltransferase [Candidatus Aminicenantes bacterium]